MSDLGVQDDGIPWTQEVFFNSLLRTSWAQYHHRAELAAVMGKGFFTNSRPTS